MNQYEIDAADMLATAYLENRGDEYNAACKVLAGVLRKRDEDVQLLAGELNKNSEAWKQAEAILNNMQHQGQQALAESERLAAESEAKLAAGIAEINARYPSLATPAGSLLQETPAADYSDPDLTSLKPATALPWRFDGGHLVVAGGFLASAIYVVEANSSTDENPTAEFEEYAKKRDAKNLAYVVAACNNLPGLLAENARLRAASQPLELLGVPPTGAFAAHQPHVVKSYEVIRALAAELPESVFQDVAQKIRYTIGTLCSQVDEAESKSEYYMTQADGPAAPPSTIGGSGGEDDENPLAVVHEVLNDWLDENEATDFDENDVASLFAMLGTAGYSIVRNHDIR